MLGNIWGQWLYLEFVWIDRPIRGRGYASRMVTAAEQKAIARGCAHSFLGTFSFRARPLYEKLGYHVFGEQKEHPKGHSHYHLTKRLSALDPSSRAGRRISPVVLTSSSSRGENACALARSSPRCIRLGDGALMRRSKCGAEKSRDRCEYRGLLLNVARTDRRGQL